jgi:glycosidase
MNLILDGVPNHSSSDSPFFDKYARHDTEGACEAEASPYRSWYFFDPARPAGTGACAGDVNYRGWFNVATLPQLDTANAAVIDNWLGEEGIALKWLNTPGVAGWRIDVVPDVVASTRLLRADAPGGQGGAPRRAAHLRNVAGGSGAAARAGRRVRFDDELPLPAGTCSASCATAPSTTTTAAYRR